MVLGIQEEAKDNPCPQGTYDLSGKIANKYTQINYMQEK